MIIGNNDLTDTSTLDTVRPYFNGEEDEKSIATGMLRDFRTGTLLTSDVNFDNIVANIDGGRWQVDYYNNIKAEDDTVGILDSNLPDPLANIIEIKNMMLYVEEFIDPTDTTSSGIAKVTGIIPNVGDIFVSKHASNRMMMYKIDTVTKLTYNLDSIYRIEYTIDSIEDEIRYADLLTKVVKRFIYDRSFSHMYGDSIIVDTIYDLKKKIEKSYDYLCKIMIDISTEMRSIMVVPSKGYNDPYLERYYFALIDKLDYVTQRSVIRSSISIPFEKSYYSALLNRDLLALKFAPKVKTYINIGQRRFLGGPGMLGSSIIDYSSDGTGGMSDLANVGLGTASKIRLITNDVDQCLCYRNSRFDIITGIRENNSIIATVGIPDPDTGTLVAPTPITPSDAFTTNLIPDVNGEFLSDLTGSLSALEVMLLSYMEGRLVDSESLYDIIQTIPTWSDDEKFYFIPHILLLIRYVLSSTYTPEQHSIIR